MVAKSGVRVEWLNSSIYFAETGMKLEQGTGRLLPDSSIKYGCEFRSIASANIYGNKGIVADGANNLAYMTLNPTLLILEQEKMLLMIIHLLYRLTKSLKRTTRKSTSHRKTTKETLE